ncbi:MAG: hypothetical protein ACK56N_01645 [Betaproteobacteria bacterium]|jgi:hypothetical protein
MKIAPVVIAGVMSTVLAGCYVVPVAPRAAGVVVAPVPPPPGVVVVAPPYPAPSIGHVWGWHPHRRHFGWYHPRHGWYR